MTSKNTTDLSNIPLKKALNVWISKFESESNHVQNVPAVLKRIIVSYFPVLIFEIPHATYGEYSDNSTYIMRLHSNNNFDYCRCC